MLIQRSWYSIFIYFSFKVKCFYRFGRHNLLFTYSARKLSHYHDDNDISYIIMRVWETLTQRRKLAMKSVSETYLEGAVVVWMVKLRCVNHVVGLRILALWWLCDLGVSRGSTGHTVLYTSGVLGFLFILLYFRFCFLVINLYITITTM